MPPKGKAAASRGQKGKSKRSGDDVEPSGDVGAASAEPVASATRPVKQRRVEKEAQPCDTSKAGEQQSVEGEHAAQATMRVLLTDLPADIGVIWHSTLSRMVPPSYRLGVRENSKAVAGESAAGVADNEQEAKVDPKKDEEKKKEEEKEKESPHEDAATSTNSDEGRVTVVSQGSDTAVIMFEVASKDAAQAAHRYLHNRQVFGRRIKVEYHPIEEVTCSDAPCLADVRVSQPLAAHSIEHFLAALPGYLALTDAEGGSQLNATPQSHFIATFADEGSALHARAVLSGRCHESSFVFISLRKKTQSKN